MKSILHIWLAPVYLRWNLDDKKSLLIWISVLPLMGAMLGLVLVLASKTKTSWLLVPKMLGFGMLLILGLLVFFWFVLLILNIGAQYSAINARLVPRLAHDMKVALAIPVLCFPVIPYLVVGFIRSSWWPSTWLLFVGVLLAYVSMIRSRWLFFVPIVLMYQLDSLGNIQRDLLLSISTNLAIISSVLLVVAGLAISYGVLSWTFALRNDDLAISANRYRIRLSSVSAPQTSAGPSLFTHLFLKCFQSAIARGNMTEQALGFNLGSGVHWSRHVPVILFATLLIWPLSLIYGERASYDQSAHVLLLLYCFLIYVLLPCAMMSSFHQALYRNQEAQKVVCLAAYSGDRSEQTHFLLKYLLRQFFILWLVCLSIFLTLAYTFSFSRLVLLPTVLGIFSVIPMAASLIRNHALTRSPSDANLLVWFFICAFNFVFFSFLQWSSHDSSIWIWCLSLFFMSILLMYFRWRAVKRVDVMFPVGRAC